MQEVEDKLSNYTEKVIEGVVSLVDSFALANVIQEVVEDHYAN